MSKLILDKAGQTEEEKSSSLIAKSTQERNSWENIARKEFNITDPIVNLIKWIKAKLNRTANIEDQETKNNGLETKLDIDLERLPALSEDPIEDIRLKTNIITDINTEVSITLPIYESIKRISMFAFGKDIKSDNLISFLQNPHIIKLMIQNIVLHNTTPNSGKQVDEETGKTIYKYLQSFQENFDPKDTQYTISIFLKKLTEKFDGYDLQKWLLENMDTFKMSLITSESKRIIPKIIYESYLEEGIKDPKKYIKQNIKHILSFKPNTRVKVRDGDQFINQQMPVLIFDMGWLKTQFKIDIEGLESEQHNIIELINILKEVIVEEINSLSEPVNVVQVRTEFVKTSTIFFEKQSQIKKFLTAKIDDAINIKSPQNSLTNFSFPVESTPPQLIDEYDRFFDAKDTREGNPYSDSYYKQLRGTFGVIETKEGKEEIEKESIRIIRNRLANIFKDVNSHIKAFHASLELGEVAIFKEVEEQNEYAELVKLAVKHENERIRYAARIKIDLAKIIFNLRFNPANVYQERHAKQVKLRLMKDPNGIRIDENINLVDLEFIETKKGAIRPASNEDLIAVQKSSEETKTEDERIFRVSLLPARFGEVNGYLLSKDNYLAILQGLFGDQFSGELITDHELKNLIYKCFPFSYSNRKKGLKRKIRSAKLRLLEYLRKKKKMTIDINQLAKNISGNKLSNGRFDYIYQKSEYSILTKLVRKSDLNPRDITDYIRMTFVVESEEDVAKIANHIKHNFMSFGKTFKSENKGWEHIDTSQSSQNLRPNLAKSDHYKSIRPVIHFTVRSATTRYIYNTLLEMRILHIDDLAKEKSQNNDASHEKYVRRREEECAETIVPAKFYPEIYEIPKDEYNLSPKQKKPKLKASYFYNSELPQTLKKIQAS